MWLFSLRLHNSSKIPCPSLAYFKIPSAVYFSVPIFLLLKIQSGRKIPYIVRAGEIPCRHYAVYTATDNQVYISSLLPCFPFPAYYTAKYINILTAHTRHRQPFRLFFASNTDAPARIKPHSPRAARKAKGDA